MTSIATITINPAIDLTVEVQQLQLNSVNRGQNMQIDAGGKGINVVSFLADYGYQTAVTGFLGRDNVEIFEQHFKHKRIDDHFVRLAGQTRTVIDATNQHTTDINLPGLQPTQEEIQQLIVQIGTLTKTCDWFVLAGNLPPGIPIEIYAIIIEQLRKSGKQIVLDTSQQSLRAGIAAGPTVIKPNSIELQQLTGHTFNDELSIMQAAQQLLQRTPQLQLVVISMGEQGAMFVDAQTALLAEPLHVLVRSTVGAGDAMVAGMLVGIIEQAELEDCARLATAFSAGTITQIGPHLPARQTLQEYARQVVIRPIKKTLYTPGN